MSTADKVIDLNVGGTLVSAQKSTLCLLEGSKLAQFFADDNNPEFLRDKNGRIFLDYDPTLFVPLLDYLRRRKVNGSTAPPYVSDNKRAQLDELIIWLGVQSYLWVPGNKFDMTLKSESMHLSTGQRIATGAGSVIGVDMYLNSLVVCKFKVEHEQGAQCPLYLGVIMHQDIQYLGPVEPHLSPTHGNYICKPDKCIAAVYGEEHVLTSGCLPNFFSTPLPTMPTPPKQYSSGTEIELILNCKKDNTLRITDDQEHTYAKKETMFLPPGCQWRFFAMIMDKKVSLHFVECIRINSFTEEGA
eukprot:TRINITY_DN1466_c0_g1_i1.p1 TRINITY_DN1466_c0_g1~~TRINITY_DN1466_c0_g1_i1.p1  ORF type:complete len:301 (+),score=22.59 TRINITY_DN1466_c0_g1_i1:84-986(+)